MHPGQLLFTLGMVAALAAAIGRGQREERVGAALIFAASAVTTLVQTSKFDRPEYGVMLVDAVLLAALIALATRTAKRWPVFAAGFQGAGVLVHVARLVAGPVHGDAYGHLAAFWAYPVLAALLWGTLVEARRRDRSYGVAETTLAQPGRRKGRRAADDHQLLTRLLELHDVGPRSADIARELIDRTGSFGAATAIAPAKLASWGCEATVINALAFARSATRSSQRRIIETRPLLPSGDAALEYLHSEIAHLPVEQFRVLYLNAKHRLLLEEVHGEGTLTEAPVYVREIMKRTIEVGAAYLILSHNHPSGDATPSREDIAITRELGATLKVIGAQVSDHFVISRSGHTSFRAAGLL